MRSKEQPATLGELIGKPADSGDDLDLDDLPELLGEKMPELPHNRVGKYRLLNALKMRFGEGYRNIPGIKNIISQFDENVRTENVVRMNKLSRSKNGDAS